MFLIGFPLLLIPFTIFNIIVFVMPVDLKSTVGILPLMSGSALELSRSLAGAFFSTVDGIAEHSRHDFSAAKEVHLKTVRLFFCPRLGINAADVCF